MPPISVRGGGGGEPEGGGRRRRWITLWLQHQSWFHPALLLCGLLFNPFVLPFSLLRALPPLLLPRISLLFGLLRFLGLLPLSFGIPICVRCAVSSPMYVSA